MVDKTVQETLKNEGQLVRNTGTNSVKSVKQRIDVNTDRLQDVLSTISDKLSGQLDLMERMVNLREVQIEKATEREQDQQRQDRLEDIEPTDSQPEKVQNNQENDSENNQTKSQGFKLPGLGTIFKGAFALGAGIPLLYKFAEGFFDEKYKDDPDNNPFNVVEDVVGGLKDLDIEQITTDFSKLSDSLTKTSSILQTLVDGAKEFLDKSWWEQFATVLSSSIGAIGAAIFAIRFATRTLLGKGIVGKALSKALTGGAAAGAGAAATRGLGASSIFKKAAGPLKVFGKALGPVGAAVTAWELGNLAKDGLDQQDRSTDQLYSMYPDARQLNRGEGVPPSQAGYYLEQLERDPDFVSDLIERQREQGLLRSTRQPEEFDQSSRESQIPSDQTPISPNLTSDTERFLDGQSFDSGDLKQLSGDQYQQLLSVISKRSEELQDRSEELLSENDSRLRNGTDTISQPDAGAMGMGLGNVLRFGDNITGGSTIRQGDVYYNNTYNSTTDRSSTVDPAVP